MQINPEAFPEQCILEVISRIYQPSKELAEDASCDLDGNVIMVLEILDFREPLFTRALFG
jgi:hypothetical protein